MNRKQQFPSHWMKILLNKTELSSASSLASLFFYLSNPFLTGLAAIISTARANNRLIICVITFFSQDEIIISPGKLAVN